MLVVHQLSCPEASSTFCPGAKKEILIHQPLQWTLWPCTCCTLYFAGVRDVECNDWVVEVTQPCFQKQATKLAMARRSFGSHQWGLVIVH